MASFQNASRRAISAQTFSHSDSESGVKGVYMSVGGTAPEAVDDAPGHHSPLFRIEARPSVITGVEASVTAAEALLRRPG